MITQQSIHLHTSVKYLSRVQNALLLTVFVKATAESCVGIFVPIFLLTHGLSLKAVFSYSFIVFISTFLSMLVALKCAQYIGMKKTMLVGISATIGFYLTLHQLTSGFNYPLIAIIDGIALGFYFSAYNLLLTKAMRRGREGRSAGVQQIAGMLAGVIGPTIGALLIKGLSFEALFAAVIGLLVLAPIPLFFTREVYAKRQSLELSKLMSRRPSRADRAIFLQGIMYASWTFWPVYIFVHYPHVTALGILTSVASGLTIFTTYVIGSSVDKRQRLAYRLGSLLYAPTWICRLLFITPIGLGINTLVANVLAISTNMAVSKDIFHLAKTSTNQSAHFARVEFYIDGGRACLFGLAVLIPNMTVLFIVTSIAALMFVGCAPHSRKSARRVALTSATIAG